MPEMYFCVFALFLYLQFIYCIHLQQLLFLSSTFNVQFLSFDVGVLVSENFGT